MASEVLNKPLCPAGVAKGTRPPERILSDEEVARYATSQGLDATQMELVNAGTNRLYRLGDSDGRLFWLKCGARRRDPEGDLLAEGLFHLGAQIADLDIPVAHAILHDRERDVLVTRHVSGVSARDVIDERSGDAGAEMLHTLGQTIARLHHRVNAPTVCKMLSRQLTCPLPSITPLSPQEYANQSLGSLHLLRMVYADSQWRHRLNLFRQGWRTLAPIHGDLRSDNLIYDKTHGFTVLDWEYACMGDPLYDVGMFMADRIEHGVGEVLRSTTKNNVMPSTLVWESLSQALTQIRPFWAGYVDVNKAIDRTSLIIVWAMAGAGLLHRVFGASMLRQRLVKQDFVMLSLARTLTLSPNRLIRGLMQ